MELFLEVVLGVLIGLIVEPVVFLIADRAKKKPAVEKTEIGADRGRFTMVYTKDTKALAWVLGGLLGVPSLGIMIAAPFIAERSQLRQAETIGMILVFAVIVAVILYFLMRMHMYKIEVSGNSVLVHTIFRVKRLDTERFDRVVETRSGGARILTAYRGNKKVCKVTNAFTNYELARERLLPPDAQ